MAQKHPVPAELQPLIAKMTCWQRNQWARAGYPVMVEVVRAYLRMRRVA